MMKIINIIFGEFENTYSNLLRCPSIQVDTLDSGDVNAQVSVDPSTPDAEENTQIPWCPSGTCEQKGRNWSLFFMEHQFSPTFEAMEKNQYCMEGHYVYP